MEIWGDANPDKLFHAQLMANDPESYPNWMDAHEAHFNGEQLKALGPMKFVPPMIAAVTVNHSTILNEFLIICEQEDLKGHSAEDIQKKNELKRRVFSVWIGTSFLLCLSLLSL